MNWVVLSLASAFTFAVISALEKILIQRYMPGFRMFLVLIGVFQFGLAIVAVPFAQHSGYGLITLLMSLASVGLAGVYIAMMFWVMRTQDVSRVVPVTSTHIIFVAILAMVFLSEVISVLAWIGIILTMAGAALMSLGPTTSESEREQNQVIPFVLLLLASFTFGLSQFLSQFVSGDIDIWSLLMWRAVAIGILLCGCLYSPKILPDLIRTIRWPAAIALTTLSEGVLLLGGRAADAVGNLLRIRLPCRDGHVGATALCLHNRHRAQSRPIERPRRTSRR